MLGLGLHGGRWGKWGIEGKCYTKRPDCLGRRRSSASQDNYNELFQYACAAQAFLTKIPHRPEQFAYTGFHPIFFRIYPNKNHQPFGF
jgi:hypothetical protein